MVEFVLPSVPPISVSELSGAPPWGAAIGRNVNLIGANVGMLANHVSVQNGRIGSMEGRLNETVKEGSDHDLSTAAAIASEATARKAVEIATEERIRRIEQKTDTLEKKTDLQTGMLTKAAAFTKDPKVVAGAYILYTIVRNWAEKHGYL